MTDHKADAQGQVVLAESVYWTDDQFPLIRAYLAEAQVHATLYLADQQRTANLIAMCNSNAERMDDPATRRLLGADALSAARSRNAYWRKLIYESLGLVE